MPEYVHTFREYLLCSCVAGICSVGLQSCNGSHLAMTYPTKFLFHHGDATTVQSIAVACFPIGYQKMVDNVDS